MPAVDNAAPFRFTLEPTRKLLLVTQSGYWDMATVTAFADEYRRALRRMKISGGCRYCLVDASDFSVQSTEVSAAIQALVESFEPDCPRRMAAFNGSQLSKMRARRQGRTSTREAFSTRQEAEAWLFADED